MKVIIPTSLAVIFCTLFSYENPSVYPSETKESTIIEASKGDNSLNTSGLEFTVYNSKTNTKYSEYSSGTFKNKLIVVSSKKIGGLGNGIDKNTNEPYSELFCMDISKNGDVSNPLFFSRILNTKHNEGQVAFSPDESIVYYTRSLRDNSKNYQLYMAYLEPFSHGNWTSHKQLTLNTNYSIEHPHVSSDGTQLYFSSNKSGGFGGYDLYVAVIQKDGSIGEPVNLGDSINTSKDEKFPSLSKDGNTFYFASEGHVGLGGLDLFLSKINKGDFGSPRNLGHDINSPYDEIALTFLKNDQGYFSSNRQDGLGSFDLYKFNAERIEQTLQGIIVEADTNKPLPKSKVVLLDEDGNEITSQVTGIDAHFSFNINAFEKYTIRIDKSGFETAESSFVSNNINNNVYKQVIGLSNLN